MTPAKLTSIVPALDWLRHYQRPWLRYDAITALTLWAVLVPQSIAYAQIGGLPPAAGLFATFAGLLAYGLTGTSRQLIVSPTSSTAAISASLVVPLAAGNQADYASLSATLAILVGLVLGLLGVLRLGFVSRFIAASVTTGFMFGLGLTIIAGQLPKLFGIPGADSDNFLPQARNIIENLGHGNALTMVIGFGGLIFLLAARRVLPGLPASLVLVIAGIGLVGLLGLAGHGVAVIGSLDSAVPAPAIPSVDLSAFESLIPGALIVGVIGYAESVTVAQSMADEHEYEVRPDQELLATGFANVLSGLFQGFIVGGGASQSAANDRAGGKTQLVSLLVSGLVVVTVIALLPLFRNLPQAALGAIVIAAVAGFLNLPALKRLAQLRRDSFIMALLAMAAVLLLGVLPGLMIAVAISIAMLLVYLARPSVSALGRIPGSAAYVDRKEDARAETAPGMLIFRLNAPLLFLNAKRLRDQVQIGIAQAPEPVRTVILDLSFTPEIDVGSLNELASLRRQLGRQQVDLRLVNPAQGVKGLLAHSDDQGTGFQVYPRLEDAI